MDLEAFLEDGSVGLFLISMKKMKGAEEYVARRRASETEEGSNWQVSSVAELVRSLTQVVRRAQQENLWTTPRTTIRRPKRALRSKECHDRHRAYRQRLYHRKRRGKHPARGATKTSSGTLTGRTRPVRLKASETSERTNFSSKRARLTGWRNPKNP